MWFDLAFGMAVGLLALGLVARGVGDILDWWALRSVGASEGGFSEGTVGGSGGPTTFGRSGGSTTFGEHGSSTTLAGNARPVSGTVESPVTGTPCLAFTYRVRAEHIDVDPDHPGTGWDELGSGAGGVRLLVDGRDETLVVDPPEFSVELSRTTNTITVPSAQDPPERVQTFLSSEEGVPRDRPSVDGPLAERTERREYREAILEPGERAFVSGVARPRSDVDEGLPRAADGTLGPPRTDGLRSRLRSFPAVITDERPDDFVTDRFRRGVGFLAVGVVLAGTALLVGWPL